MRAILLPAILVAASALAQYNGPESVEYDPVGDRYFVSNTQTSRIKVQAQDGTVTDHVVAMPSVPYGLEIMGEVLYACTGNGVRGYSLTTGAEVYYRNLIASFPNGITTDGEHLYITDFNSNARRIYKVDPIGDTHTTLVANTGGQPNGIVWDPIGDRLVVVFWGSNAPIKAYDRSSGEETTLVANTGVGNIDGITIDCDGNFLVASWNPARITRYEPTFSVAGVNMGIAGLSNPADIDFDPVNERICIPNSGNNTVLLYDQSCLASGLHERAQQGMKAWPNPVRDALFVVPPFDGPEPFSVYDASGAVVLTGTLQPGAPVQLGFLAPGLYMVMFPAAGASLKVLRD